MNLILTDEIDSGKSTFVLKLAIELIESCISVSGWITPAHMEDGKKVGHDFIAIDCGKIEEAIPFTRLHPFAGSFPWRRFHFNPEAFERASALVDGIVRITSHESRVTDLFIMDEIGPLEVEHGQGFAKLIPKALAAAPTTLIVARAGMEEDIRHFLGDDPAGIFTLAESAKLTEKITS